jgi:hypothetical protein
MAADLKASTYLVDGDDLQVSGVELLHDGAGLWAGLAEDIGVSTAAGRDGGIVAGGVCPPFTLSTLFEIRDTDAQAVWAAVVALRRRCKMRRTVTLTRRMPDPDGSDANIDVTTTARRQTDRPEWIERNNRLQLDIDWLITGGPWLGASVAIPAVGTVTVKGDLPTRHITATLSAGAANPVVTNASNGYTFRFVGTVPTGGVVVDVLARKATGTAGDLSSALKWSKDDPFQLDPGPQTLTVSDGTASFTYSPAYA